MSTDDSISEDVSSSGGLSHCHVSPDGDGGKESETSMVSSASGLTVSEDRHTTSQTTGGTVQCRLMDNTPACKIRDMCLSPDEAFEHEKNLPFINPSSLETLRALVQEIRSSGETDPEIWKDCEDRWLHLFQLVEKQYQEQILAQQEQYQCQIQLIQDEIKALVQIQNRQGSVQPNTDLSKTTEDHILPTISTHCSILNDNDNLLVPSETAFRTPMNPLRGAEERATTVLSSGYGTLSAWDMGIGTARSLLEDEKGSSDSTEKQSWSLNIKDQATSVENQLKCTNGKKPRDDRKNNKNNQQQNPGSNHQLTSWAQRHKLRPKKNKTQMQLTETLEPPNKTMESHQQMHLESTDSLDQQRSYAMRRSDSLISEASGLTYWRLNENDLYYPLPDSFDSGAPHTSMSFTPTQPPLSLKEIYQTKRDTDYRLSDRDDSLKSSPLSPQVLTLDPTTRHSDRTSGFTSPSHFSSPSLSTPSQLGHREDTPITPDSMVEGSPHPGDMDYNSDASSVSATGHSTLNSTLKVQDRWTSPSMSALHNKHQLRGSEGGSQSLSPKLQQSQGSAALEDPVVLSLLRQNLREKHSRHVADLKAYYEAEIQSLLEKLRLADLPKDLEKSNQALTERCKHLEKALAEATSRIQDLEANNSSMVKKLSEWSERYAVAGATVKSLQKRLDESKRSSKEKDALVTRFQNRVCQLEEEAQTRGREKDEKEMRREREYKMLQDLLGEYDSLMKEHEGVKINLVSTENKLVDAHDQISELKRTISKLESQVKQLEHENQARARYSSHSNTQPSGAGLFHHPDLLLSPTKSKVQPDVTFPYPPNDQKNDGLKSIKSPFNEFSYKSTGSGYSLNSAAGGSWSYPESEPPQPLSRLQDQGGGQTDGRKQNSCITPMMRALIELEETRATQSRAPWVDNAKTTVGFVERRLKEPLHEQEVDKPPKVLEKKQSRALLKLQRSLSPDGHRSSSLPPPNQRNIPPTTPSKRETLLMPLSAKSSPKRCPTENFSTAFGHRLPREEHFLHSSSPKKRLVFTSTDREHDQPDSPDVHSQLDWDDLRHSPMETSVLDKVQSLSEAERLFDELTQEKLQIEAALSRMPGAGGRVSLQTRLDEVSLENRLERLNRELGSLRMTLKRFHILRTSANL